MNHVLIDCERTRHPNTGLFQFCRELGEQLIRLHDPNQESLHFYLPEEQRNLFGPDQQVVLQRHWHKFFQPGAGKYQVWHCTFQNSNYLPYHRNTKRVLTVNDLNFLVEIKDDKARIQKYLDHIQKNINRADHIVCISDYTRRHMLEFLKPGNKPVVVVYDGCDIKTFPGFDAPTYRPARPFIFSIGTVLPKKNFHVLPCLLKGNDYELVIAGIINKEYGERIMEEARVHGVSDRVKLTGPISEQDRYWYYKNCAAFGFPSIAEGFGLPVVEAMNFGKPAFISTHTSLPELGGDAAYYFRDFDPQDMQEVFSTGMQHYQSANPIEKIRAQALKFNWDHTARSYLSIYRSLYQ